MAIRVAVSGALGKMGREVVKTVLADPDLTLVGAVDPQGHGQPLGTLLGLPQAASLTVDNTLSEMLTKHQPDVCVDFTHPDVVLSNTLTMIETGCRPVIGTTGLKEADLEKIRQALTDKQLGGIVAPNFALGAVLMMKFAQEAAKYFDHAEIIEMHHNQKADAPSGTALKTAELMAQSCARFSVDNAPETEILPGARGGKSPAHIQIHSVRLPGYVAHQEVLFGGPGQILTLRHDSLDRASFMPGVAMAAKKVMHLQGLTYGLEHLL